MLPRKQRLSKRDEFTAVAKRGRVLRSRLLMLRALSNGLEQSRFGFTVSKRVGKAVVRNRVKRRLRAILRHTPVNQGWDIVISPRQEAAAAAYSDLKRVVHGLLHQAGLLAPRESEAPRLGDE